MREKLPTDKSNSLKIFLVTVYNIYLYGITIIIVEYVSH